jgi:hypothetical protein
MQRITTTKEYCRELLLDAMSILAASLSSVSWETVANCYWKAGFCETSEPHDEENVGSEVSSCI